MAAAKEAEPCTCRRVLTTSSGERMRVLTRPARAPAPNWERWVRASARGVGWAAGRDEERSAELATRLIGRRGLMAWRALRALFIQTALCAAPTRGRVEGGGGEGGGGGACGRRWQ